MFANKVNKVNILFMHTWSFKYNVAFFLVNVIIILRVKRIVGPCLFKHILNAKFDLGLAKSLGY